MKNKAKSTCDTRRLYKFEREWFRGEPNVGIDVLRKLAEDIWKEAGHSGYYYGDKVKPMPAVVAGKGTKYNGRYYSYCDGERVVLARSERKKFVLVHEMVHALGYDDHDEQFVDKYFELLDYYKICDMSTLCTIGANYGIWDNPVGDIW